MNLKVQLGAFFILILSSFRAVTSEGREEEFGNNSTQRSLKDVHDLRPSSNVEKRTNASSDILEDGWAQWSQWSICSRSCDGGVTTQLRKCDRKTGCKGASVKYRICNMQPCPDVVDFRATQCTAYNNIPYRGTYYEWTPFYDPEDPCSLTCQSTTYKFVAKLAPKVQDGTRCRDGALDMCVAGNCLSVGCDLQLDSTMRIDDCGICGGDGSSCRVPVYSWGESQFSPCSVTCGGGYQMSRPVCVDKDLDEEVDERLCDHSMRPQARVRECNTFKCPAQWVTESWGPCTQSCGGGRQMRLVYCTQGGTNGTKVRVSDHHCPRQKPAKERPCGTKECPIWFEGPWTPCSKSCGTGHQTRTVVCRDNQGLTSDECNPTTMPLTKQPCSLSMPCTQELQSADMVKNPQEDAPPTAQRFASRPRTQRLTQSLPISTEPTFTATEWGPCNVTCGEGYRKREVKCKIYLQFSKTIADLPDKHCTGSKPASIERCFPRHCSMDQNNGLKSNNVIDQVGIVVTYSWSNSQFTACSKFCLGGHRESNVQCVRDHDKALVSPYLCDMNKKPDAITETCNDRPCPPRWNVSDFSPCSKSCGAGVQVREIQCIHEMTRGALNTLVVHNRHCPQPPPRIQQMCNMLECPTRWFPEPWSKCSKSCGGGVKTRKIHCQKELAYGIVLKQPPSRCPKRRPKTNKPCNKKACDTYAPGKSDIYVSQNMYFQKQPQAKVSLKVGGRAIVFKGTNVKIRCPSRKGNKTQVLWFKNKIPLDSTNKYRITRKGTLRIRKISFGSSGVYSCVVGKSKADININVKPLPAGYGTSDEDPTVERPQGRIVSNNPELKTMEEPDYSHEKTVRENEKTAKDKFSDPNRSHDTFTKYRTSKHPNILDPPDQSSDEKYSRKEDVKAHKSKPKPFVPDRTATPDPEPPGQDDPSTADTWEYKHGGTLFSDQDSGELNAGSPHAGEGQRDDEEPARSGAASQHSLPQIQQLLVNIQSSLRGQRKPTSIEDIEDEPVRVPSWRLPTELGTNSFILGKGKPENLEFAWMTTDWSECSRHCGGTGIQVRTTQCLVTLKNVSEPVASSLCEDAGLPVPPTRQKCGFSQCPSWAAGPWGLCPVSNCFTWKTSLQERQVFCQLPNKTVVDDKYCSDTVRLNRDRECFNDQCRGTWIVGEWSECTVSCGANGFQTRILQCVWYGTKRPAGNSCRDQPRPSVTKPCNGQPCDKMEDSCEDRSKFCNVAKGLNLCHMSNYRQQCCQSCRGT